MEVQFMEILEIYAFIAFLIYALGIIATVVVIIAIWRGMKAQERMANSMERIEEMIKQNQTQL
jgi:uncharacterized membrane protein